MTGSQTVPQLLHRHGTLGGRKDADGVFGLALRAPGCFRTPGARIEIWAEAKSMWLVEMHTRVTILPAGQPNRADGAISPSDDPRLQLSRSCIAKAEEKVSIQQRLLRDLRS